MFQSVSAILCFSLLLAAPVPASSEDLRNANHIFNAIHSSMRQWGSSLYHNGHSFFIAEVPANTQLYHGRGDNSTVTGIEWVAFEPEHSLHFTLPRHRKPSLPNKPPHKSPPPGQVPLNASPDDSEAEPFAPTWLRTYNTKRTLKFLYIDGTSAGKTDKGTMDTQDYVLLARKDHTDPFWEYERAKRLCALIQDEWGSDLSGIIRMEAGFEIIMCSFADSLDFKYQTAIIEEPQPYESRQFAYMRAMASRYHGIGEGRVTLDYERMVTAYRDLNFPERNEEQRLNTTKDRDLAKLRQEVKDMALDSTADRFAGINWQAVADMIVLRWADFLRFALTPYVSKSKTQFEAELAAVLRPFTNELEPNATTEAYRCSRQHLTGVTTEAEGNNGTSSLAQQAVTSIAEKICGTLVDVAHDKKALLEERVGKIKELVNYLKWTTFMECRGCGYDEVCMVAAWPFGDKDDHYSPSCKNETRAGQGSEYWGDRRWGPRNWQSLSMHGRMPL